MQSSSEIENTHQKGLEDTENSQLIKDEAYDSRDLTKMQIQKMQETKISIETIKDNIITIDASTKELINRVSNI